MTQTAGGRCSAVLAGWLGQAGGCEKRVDHESTGACSGDGRRQQEEQQLRKSEQADGGRQAGRARSLTRSAETSGAEARETLTHAGRPCCLLLCPEAAEIARTAQG